MTTVRLYGVSRSNGSFGRVAAGLREGLEDLGAFAGFVPIDSLEEDDEVFPGAQATVGLFTGPPSMVRAMATYGEHERCYAILALNSEWLPEKLIAGMIEYTKIVSPSSWGAKVIERYTGELITPYHHGVSKLFTARSPDKPPLRAAYDDGQFRVLHLSSTDRGRKGTDELVKAWCMLVKQNALGLYPKLHLIVDVPEGTFPQADDEPTIAFPTRNLNLPAQQMCALYQGYHLVCQPSRGEGFGMVPLEARASGVPVCGT